MECNIIGIIRDLLSGMSTCLLDSNAPNFKGMDKIGRGACRAKRYVGMCNSHCYSIYIDGSCSVDRISDSLVLPNNHLSILHFSK